MLKEIEAMTCILILADDNFTFKSNSVYFKPIKNEQFE